jgi:hypothetical protein
MDKGGNSGRDVKWPLTFLSCRGSKKIDVLYMRVAYTQGPLISSYAMICFIDTQIYTEARYLALIIRCL